MKESFDILIVEDELMIAEMIKEMLLELDYNVIGIAKNHSEAFNYLSKTERVDMVFLDINLEDNKDGIDIAKHIQDNYNIPYIYLTSYSDPTTIRKAAATTPSAYLLKPFTKGDLFATAEIVRARKYQNSKFILIKDGHFNVKIDSMGVLFIKSDNNYLEVVTAERKFIVRNSMEKFLTELGDSNFIRIHRSYAVNILNVDAINGQFVIIGKVKFPLSRSYKDEVLDYFRNVKKA